MCDDWLSNMDEGKINCVVFLDIRKGFDSINHEILLEKIKSNFGISGDPILKIGTAVYGKWANILSKKDAMWSSTGFYSWSFALSIIYK